MYGIDEYGTVLGEIQMMSEIYARGPISCSLNSEAEQFDKYKNGIITCNKGKECYTKGTDHVVVIAGWGVDKQTGLKYWVGRNSYGTRWGESSGGGWFRLQRGNNTLNIESAKCSWAVPAKIDVERAIQQYDSSIAV